MRLITILLSILYALQLQAQEPPKVDGAQIEFESSVHNFGVVKKGDGDLHHDFEFINRGNEPLVILRVKSSCSCLKAKYPHQPIAPNQKGVIRVRYQIEKKELGTFNKVLQIHSTSTSERDILTVRGEAVE